jgi:glucose-1-phosphate adenylyltransferase
VISRGARIRRSIIDEGSVVGANARVGGGDASVANRLQPTMLDFGITLVGRKTRIPDGMRVGTNCMVSGSRKTGRVPRRDIEDGGYYIARER